MNNKAYVAATPILNFQSYAIQDLIRTRNWQGLATHDKIGAAYAFVQNEINFGYNRADNIPASQVLEDGYGQCNTKGTLLMALLRALNIPCPSTRLHHQKITTKRRCAGVGLRHRSRKHPPFLG